MKLHEFLAITHNRDKLVDFLIANNLIHTEIRCPKCNNKLIIDRSNLSFRCRKAFYEKNKHKKYVKKQCLFRTSAKVDTWFHKSKLTVETICRMTAYFIMIRSPRHNFLYTELEISEHSVVDWTSFCREVSIKLVNW